MNETIFAPAGDILLRVVIAALIGGAIAYERRFHHKAIGVAGIMLIADFFPDPVRQEQAGDQTTDPHAAQANIQQVQSKSK